jgi:hypothetical protein
MNQNNEFGIEDSGLGDVACGSLVVSDVMKLIHLFNVSLHYIPED